jgi:hypothetical protein
MTSCTQNHTHGKIEAFLLPRSVTLEFIIKLQSYRPSALDFVHFLWKSVPTLSGTLLLGRTKFQKIQRKILHRLLSDDRLLFSHLMREKPNWSERFSDFPTKIGIFRHFRTLTGRNSAQSWRIFANPQSKYAEKRPLHFFHWRQPFSSWLDANSGWKIENLLADFKFWKSLVNFDQNSHNYLRSAQKRVRPGLKL